MYCSTQASLPNVSDIQGYYECNILNATSCNVNWNKAGKMQVETFRLLFGEQFLDVAPFKKEMFSPPILEFYISTKCSTTHQHCPPQACADQKGLVQCEKLHLV